MFFIVYTDQSALRRGLIFLTKGSLHLPAYFSNAILFFVKRAAVRGTTIT